MGEEKLAVLLFLLAVTVYVFSAGGHFYSSDAWETFLSTESIVEYHTLEIVKPVFEGANPAGNWLWFVTPEGKIYSRYGLGQSLLFIPFYIMGKMLNPNAELTHFTDFATYFSFTDFMFNPLITALTVVVVFFFARKMKYSVKLSAALALLFAFATQAWPYAKTLFNAPLVTLFIALAAYYLWGPKKHSDLFYAGFFAGLAAFVRYDFMMFIFPLGLYVLWAWRGSLREKLVAAAFFAAPFAAWIAVNALYDYVRVGSVFTTSLRPNPGFATPLLTGLYGLLFSPGVGLFIYSPVLLLSLVGLYDMWRRRREGAVLFLAWILPLLIVFSAFTDWHGWLAWGTRYLVPASPFMILALGAAIEKRWKTSWFKAIFVLLLLLTLSVNLLGVIGNIVTAFNMPSGIMSLREPGEFVPAKAIYDFYYAPIAYHARLISDESMFPLPYRLDVPLVYGFTKQQLQVLPCAIFTLLVLILGYFIAREFGIRGNFDLNRAWKFLPSKNMQVAEFCFLAALSALMAVFLLYDAHLPGIYSDEVYMLASAVQMLNGQSIDAVWSVDLFGHPMLLQCTDYIGPVSAYLGLPFIVLFGPTGFSLRLADAVYALLIMYATYFAVRITWDRKTAVLVALLLAVSPTFLFLERVSIYGQANLFAATLFLAVVMYRKTKNAKYLYAAGLLAGLGVNAALQFTWFLIAIALWLLVDRPKPLPTVKQAAIAVFLIALGAGTLIAYNVMHYDAGILAKLGILDGSFKSSGGVQNLDVVGNQGIRLSQLNQVLVGSMPAIGAGTVHFNGLNVKAFWVALAGLAAYCLFRAYRRKITFTDVLPIWLLAIVMFLSGFTVSGFAPYHMLILYPWIPLVIGRFASVLLDIVPKAIVVIVIIAFALLLFSEVGISTGYLRDIATYGGKGLTSDAIYGLNEYLLERNASDVVAMDWGFYSNLAYLSNGRIRPLIAFGWTSEPDAWFNESAKALMARKNATFLFHSDDFTQFKHRRETMAKLAEGGNMTFVLERTFYQRDGNPVYYVYRSE